MNRELLDFILAGIALTVSIGSLAFSLYVAYRMNDKRGPK